MNFNQLKYFHTICTLGSFSAAASHLYVSQPSLSAAIKELEKEYGVALFSRHHRGVIPTAAGERLFHLAGEILNKIELTKKEMVEMGKGKSLIRLGVPPMIGSMLLPFLYQRFFSEYPEFSPSITEGGRREVLQRLDSGEVDMVFLPHVLPFEKEYDTLFLARLEIACCAVSTSPLSQKKVVTPKDLEKVPLVLFEDGFFQTSLVKNWFEKAGVTPFVLLQTTQLSTMLSALSDGIAAGFCFSPLIHSEKRLISIPTRSPLWCDVSLVRSAKREVTPPMVALSEFLKENPIR